QLTRNTPYNTYRHTGLPPTPIDSPGDAAIQAALHADPTAAARTWLYFVTVDPKSGVTKFTSNYSQFLQWENELSANIAAHR
ncbi:MAG TPA: endolytic transglycosylase MltG, partial [Streptosporangiaceae bacterium]|nr:endolytic transglycosylase MltG [Streptosporangiaceae bacterium]